MISWKGERQSLSPEQLEESIRSAAAPFVDTASTIYLNKILLDDPKIKFQVHGPFLICRDDTFIRNGHHTGIHH
jgi:hypothetical protein